MSFTYPHEKMIEPSKLIEIIKNPSAPKPMIFNVGPSPNIPGAIKIGDLADPINKEKLKEKLINIPKNKNIVVYCGCCKLEDCWNIHEANKLLTNLNYSNFKILNLPTDFYTDWINKKYPIEQ
jgi:hypothetical protein